MDRCEVSRPAAAAPVSVLLLIDSRDLVLVSSVQCLLCPVRRSPQTMDATEVTSSNGATKPAGSDTFSFLDPLLSIDRRSDIAMASNRSDQLMTVSQSTWKQELGSSDDAS
ncbi:hypothetical protein J6590_045315 [Homalodisca vitripennis]|nr:hypothetical protein J6590_045315 [Homalodisca vitripennis]